MPLPVAASPPFIFFANPFHLDKNRLFSINNSLKKKRATAGCAFFHHNMLVFYIPIVYTYTVKTKTFEV